MHHIGDPPNSCGLTLEELYPPDFGKPEKVTKSTEAACAAALVAIEVANQDILEQFQMAGCAAVLTGRAQSAPPTYDTQESRAAALRALFAAAQQHNGPVTPERVILALQAGMNAGAAARHFENKQS